DLDAGPAALELLVAGYAAAYASGLVTFGRLGDAWGRKRLFVGGMVAFTLASAACAAAPSAVLLVLARLAQGLAASVMVPQVLAVTLVALLVPVSLGAELGWPLWCRMLPALALGTGAVLAATQIRRERAGGLPLIPPSVLRLPAMHAGLLAAFLFFLACGGFLF